ncbi:Uncharacterised protein g4556 [Pycnogonum litorale]
MIVVGLVLCSASMVLALAVPTKFPYTGDVPPELFYSEREIEEDMNQRPVKIPFGEDGLEFPEPEYKSNAFDYMFNRREGSADQPCTSPDDCLPGECCVISMNRFSIPLCTPLGQLKEHCIMDNEAYDTDLYYPNSLVVNVTEIHRLFCPCDRKFICHKNECRPKFVGGSNDLTA